MRYPRLYQKNNFRTASNCNPDREVKMALDLQCPKEPQWIHREISTRLESPRASGSTILERRGKE
jgi:hypothetical protein